MRLFKGNNIIDDKIFEFAFKMAFRDATLRRAFPRLKDEQIEDVEYEKSKCLKDVKYNKRKEKCRNASKSLVKDYIVKIFDTNNPIPDALKTIEEVCKNTESYMFTFGNAQKLVNMTAKYMFISTFEDEKKREGFRKCHCPMDRIIISKLSEELKREYPCIKWDKVSWSTISQDNHSIYDAFQEFINRKSKTEGMPLEIDFMFWD